MQPLTRLRAQRAFTLVELLVVMVVIATLALIVVPRVVQRTTQAQEANLHANLRILRSAISQYQADTGGNPPNLNGLYTNPGSVTGWNGPYLTGTIPLDPFGGTPAANSTNGNWTYTAASGAIASSSSTTGINGTAYNTW